jgi:hypothetical protein
MKSWEKKCLVGIVVGVAMTVAAVVGKVERADAHTGQGSISCEGVSLSFQSFPNKPNNTVAVRVSVDGHVHGDTFTWNGPTGSVFFPLDLVGQHTVVAVVSWNTNGVTGSFTVGPTDLHCGQPKPPPPPGTSTTSTTTPQPPETVTSTVTTTVQSPPTVIVKYRTRVIVKWRTRWLRHVRIIRVHAKCSCPPGTILYHGHCAVPGKG